MLLRILKNKENELNWLGKSTSSKSSQGINHWLPYNLPFCSIKFILRDTVPLGMKPSGKKMLRNGRVELPETCLKMN